MAGLVVFAIASPALFAPYGQNGGYSPDLHIAAWVQVSAIVLFTLYAFACVRRSKITFKSAPTYLPALLLLLWAAMSIIWAREKYHAVFTALNWTGGMLLALMVILVIRTPKAYRQLMTGIAVSGFLIALLGVAQYLFASDMIIQYIAPSGTFNNKNMLGQFCIMILPVAFVLMLTEKNTARAWLYALFVSILMTVTFYTHAKGSLLALLIEIIVFVLLFLYLRVRYQYKPFADKQKRVMSGVAVVLFLGLSYLQPTMFSEREDIVATAVQTDNIMFLPTGVDAGKHVLNSVVSSSDIRFIMWRNSMGMLLDHPLIGVGIGNWTDNYDTYQAHYQQDYKIMEGKYHANAHNDYIEILCELGLIGAALFLWLLVALAFVIRRILSAFAEKRASGDVPLALGPLVGLVGIGVCALVSFPFKQAMSVLLIFVYVAFLSSVYATLTPKPVRKLNLFSREIRLTFAVICVAFSIAWVYLHINWFISEREFRVAAYNYTKGKHERGMEHSVEAMYHNGLRTQLMWLYGANLTYTGRVKEAIPWLIRALDGNRHSPAILQGLAVAYNVIGKRRLASDMIGRLHEAQDLPRLLRKQATYLFEGGYYDESVEKLKHLRSRLIAMRDSVLLLKHKRHRREGIAFYNRKLDKLAVLIAEREAIAREKREEVAGQAEAPDN